MRTTRSARARLVLSSVLVTALGSASSGCGSDDAAAPPAAPACVTGCSGPDNPGDPQKNPPEGPQPTPPGDPAPKGSVVSSDGKIDNQAYEKLAGDAAALVDYLGGPGFATFHGADAPVVPTIATAPGEGRFCFGDCDGPAVDWAGYAGQILHQESNGPGVSRARFSWSRHQQHGGKQFAHLYLLAPLNTKVEGDGDSWFTSVVDPGVDAPDWKAANGGAQLKEPIAIGRGKVTWSNNGILAFRNGLIGAVGSGNSGDSFPFVKLPDHKVPTDVAVTNNGELALVTVWDTTTHTGQLAVIALTDRDGKVAGLPTEGFVGSLKLLGFVDLPIAAPTRVAASVDFGLYMVYSSKDAQAELATQAGRDRWAASEDAQHTASKAGFALVASRDENAVVVVDLEPTIAFFREMYLTTQARYDETKNLGPGDDAFPYTFSHSPSARPTVSTVLQVTAPASVVTGFPVGDRSYSDGDFAKRAYVASVDGTLHRYDARSLAVAGSGDGLVEDKTLTICKNPTRVFYGRGGPSRDGLAFVCRGDRAVSFVEKGGEKTTILTDSRLIDPVGLSLGDSRGAEVLTIADSGAGAVLNYLVGPIDAWGDKIFGGLGPSGDDPFAYVGKLATSGKPFDVSSAQVP
jgi:hypothetical protein